MGLLSAVLTLPLAPVRGVTWVSERLLDAADRELHDPDVVRARLRALNQAYEDGEIGAEEFEREEDRLLDLLEGRVPPAAVPPALPAAPAPAPHEVPGTGPPDDARREGPGDTGRDGPRDTGRAGPAGGDHAQGGNAEEPRTDS